MSCFGDAGEHPKGAAVSITSDNLRDNLWSEIAKWRERSPFLSAAFEWTKERLFSKDHPNTWFLSARSFSKTANADEQGRTLSGLHAKYVFYLIDESGDIHPAVLRSAEQGLSNCSVGMIVQAGNPTSLDGMLYQAATAQRAKWDLFTITADPDDPMRSPRVDADWAREQIQRYGRENPWVQSYVLGQFPVASMNALVGVEQVAASMARSYRPDAYAFQAKVLGVDVARFGDDRTVIFPRQGLQAFEPIIMRGARTEEIVGQIVRYVMNWNADAVMVDGTGGWGAGVVDALRLSGVPVHEINASGKAYDARYFNRRAECWFTMCEWIKTHGALPNLPEMVQELTAPTYVFHNGKFQLEAKEHIKARIGRSCDLADAASLTWAESIMPTHPNTGLHLGRQQPVMAICDYDPFAEMR